MWREGNPPSLLVGMELDVATMENSMEVPQTLQSYSWAYIQIKTQSERIPMFIAILFITAKTWKQPKYPLTR